MLFCKPANCLSAIPNSNPQCDIAIGVNQPKNITFKTKLPNMVPQGTVMVNSATGDKLEFVETSASSNGKRVVIKWTAVPKGIRPPVHIHKMQHETFEIIKGHLTHEVDGKTEKLGPGTKLVFPAGNAHTHYNAEATECEFLHIVEPALDFEDLFYRINRLAELGIIKPTGKAEPPLLEVMVWIKKYEAKTYLAGIPIGVQNAMATVLAPIGKALGYGG